LANPPNQESASLWRPLRSSTFRNLLIADVVSDVGTFMQSVGAAWLMVSLNAGPLFVALTQTASALPFFVLALPAGAIHHAMDNGMSREEAEKLASAPPAPRPVAAVRPSGASQRPAIDLTKLNIPIIIINGEFDHPRAKSTRAAREANDVTIVVLPGKQHLPAIVNGSIPKEYVSSLVGFINTHDQI